jgi:pantoate--beta-alanine ligase
MEVVETKSALRAALAAARGRGLTVGLVPTMGYLHDGHLSHMERSAAEDGFTVATIFVNPLQFAPNEDLATYPRDLEGDRAKAEAAGVDLLFTPSTEEMYPEPVRTTVSVDVGVGVMESAARPTHFDGVTTVVAKLFSLVGACRAYFGEKDYQQLTLVRRMVRDLDLPVEVVAGATIRERDGLAMSSRNAYLTPEQRLAAPMLYASLQVGASAIEAGQRDGTKVRAAIASMIEGHPLFELDYAEVVDADSLERLDHLEPGAVRLLVAARLGVPRLLDNLGVTVA